MKIKVSISRKSVMGLVEGISLTISQHNGGTPSMQQLWASDAESPKLDIYYREAIGDLERKLTDFLVESSAQFDLQAEGEDYTLNLNVAASWPKRMQGLLGNKVQDYLVHSVTAGWLNDFEGVSVKQDYEEMAAKDMEDIRYIVEMKNFAFTEHERQEEEEKSGEDGTTADERKEDDSKRNVDGVIETAEARSEDTSKDQETESIAASERYSDEEKGEKDSIEAGIRSMDADKNNKPADVKATQRTAESDKETTPAAASAGDRHDKDDNDHSAAALPDDAGERHGDDSCVDTRHPWTDWSGTHIWPPIFRLKR